MRIVEVKIFKFNELKDKAKEKARDWFRSTDFIGLTDHCEDFEHILGLAGFIDITTTYSGFYSQGDGASFTGIWVASNFDEHKLAEYLPRSNKYWDSFNVFNGIKTKCPDACFTIKRMTHHYYHENTVSFSAEAETEDCILDEFAESARNLMQAFYESLEEDYEYQMSDENIDELLTINEYEFTEDGEVFR